MNKHRRIVETYLDAHQIVPGPGPLKEDLAEENEVVLADIAYLITHYSNLPGVLENVKALAMAQSRGNDDERIYDNKLTEVMTLWFVTEVLGQNVTGLEAVSRFRTGNKTCDLETTEGNRQFFYEVKDLSSEIMTQIPDQQFSGMASFTPVLPDKIRSWIAKYVANCIQKGANFLICRVPAWHVKGRPKLSEDWVAGVYSEYQRVGRHCFRVQHGLSVPRFFQGVYVIRRDERIFLQFN